jgi:peptide/nickel transport system substrate-binding protein
VTAKLPNTVPPILLGGTLTAYQQGDFGRLDPQGVNAASEIGMARLLFRTLTALTSSGNGGRLLPDLATNLGESSADFSVWKYTLRPGLAFEDGSLLTAADVKYGIQRSFSPHFSGGLNLVREWLTDVDGYVGNQVNGLPSIEVLSSRVVVFHLRRSCPDWPYIVAQPAAAAVSRSGAMSEVRGPVPICSGPYRIQAWIPGQRMTLTRNPRWDRSTDDVRVAGPDEMNFEFAVPGTEIDERLIEDASSGRTAIMLGSALEPQTIEALRHADSLERVARAETGCIRFLAINTKRVSEVGRRQLLLNATDVPRFQRARGLTTSRQVTTILPPSISGRVSDMDSIHRGDRNNDADLVGGVEGFHIDIAMPDTEGNRAGVSALVAGYEEHGIEADVRFIPNSEYGAHVAAHRNDYDVMLHGWCAVYPDPASVIPPLFHSTAASNGQNLSQYENPEVDRTIEKIYSTPSRAERLRMWNGLDDLIMRDVPVIPMLASTAMALHGSRVRGCVIHPGFGQIDLAVLHISPDRQRASATDNGAPEFPRDDLSMKGHQNA